MTGENRVLAYFGLQVINSNPRPGIKALVHQVKKQTLDITDVVLSSHPESMLGRIKHGNHAVALLTEFDFEQAQQFASEIEQYNSDRKDLDKQITKGLTTDRRKMKRKNVLPPSSIKNWHKGVIGIVALA
jgi:single-stranded-DNA-specific exonuclease